MKAYLEFGASFEPNYISLVKFGWHGIFVEPHPAHVIKCYEYLVSLPDASFEFYNGIVGADEDRIMVFRSSTPTFSESSFCSKESGAQSSIYKSHSWQNCVGPGLKMLPISLDRLVRESKYPVEYFQIDCEGMEIDIFESYSWHHKPSYIRVAVHAYDNSPKLESYNKERLSAMIVKQDYHEIPLFSHDLAFRKNDIVMDDDYRRLESLCPGVNNERH